MNVLCVSPGLDAVYGGPPTATANSVIAAHQAGVATTVVFAHKSPTAAAREPAVRQLNAAGIETLVFPINRAFAQSPHAWGISTALAAWLWRRAGGYDIVHVGSPWGLHCVAAIAAARRWRRPVVLSPHTSLTKHDMASAHSGVLRVAKHLLSAAYGRLLSGVVFSSELELRDSTRRAQGRNWAVIYHPVFGAPAPRRGGGGRDGLRLGFLGRLHPIKNLEGLLHALTGTATDIDLTIAGDGAADYVAALRHTVQQLGLNDRVRWTGFVAGDDKAAFLDDIDVLVMPSHHECFGMVAAEAMAAGVPVVVARQTGVAEIVEKFDAGVITEPDPASIRRAILELAGSPGELDRLGENGRRAVAAALSPPAHGTALRRYYEQVAA